MRALRVHFCLAVMQLIGKTPSHLMAAFFQSQTRTMASVRVHTFYLTRNVVGTGISEMSFIR